MLTLELNQDQKQDHLGRQTEKTKEDRNKVHMITFAGPTT